MRKPVCLSGILLAFVLVPSVASASGGGGCGQMMSEAAGTSVEIEGFCFQPTVLYAATGEEITWTNRDATRHDVVDANAAWGSFEALRQGRTLTSRFDRPGVYPYACTWHPGMSGAIVVGDAGLDRLDVAPVARVAKGEGELVSTDRAAEAALVAVGGLAILGGLALARRRWAARRPGS